MARRVQFEIAADDPARAIAFYSGAFGWVFEKWDGPIEYWLISTGNSRTTGIDGGLVRRRGPLIGPENTIGVVSIDIVLQKIQANGGNIIRAKTAIPGVGWSAYCQDTEGNNFSLMESDPTAK